MGTPFRIYQDCDGFVIKWSDDHYEAFRWHAWHKDPKNRKFGFMIADKHIGRASTLESAIDLITYGSWG